MGARIEVRQLRYAGEHALAGRVEFAVADALRTEVIDDGRLVLVRSFRLGRIAFGSRATSLAAASAWRGICEAARHGGESGAESANCVWFRDLAEARTVLMRELAGGRPPLAWFWPLAVPDWRRETLARWLDRRLEEAADDASGETAAALVAEAQAAGCTAPLTAAILARATLSAAAELAADVHEDAAETGEGAGSRPAPPSVPAAETPTEPVALAIARAVPAPLRAALASAAGQSDLAVFVEALARGLTLRAHAALVLAPTRLAAVTAAVSRILRSGGNGPAPAPVTPSRRPYRVEGPVEIAEPLRPSASEAERASAPAFGGRAQIDAEAAPARSPALATPPVGADHQLAELRSEAAGLFLAITPLIRLGWREWLAARPHLLLHQPGPRLLRRIAGHYRVPLADPLWDQIPEPSTARDAPPGLEEALRLWRTGLDRWLRREARLPLSAVVRRTGWILSGAETTIVRFPLRSIEIRLRRRALDADPGWVDWLGRAYRVVYRDQPLLGPEAS